MVNVTNEIINQIKEATDDSRIIVIIENSFHKLHAKNSFSAKRRFMLNMVMALQYVKAESLQPKTSENIEKAIEIIEQFRKQGIR